jgi:hypothetical protein
MGVEKKQIYLKVEGTTTFFVFHACLKGKHLAGFS